jgi:hypothetical protein
VLLGHVPEMEKFSCLMGCCYKPGLCSDQLNFFPNLMTLLTRMFEFLVERSSLTFLNGFVL